MDNLAEAPAEPKSLTDDEIRALFESSVSGLESTGRAVPKDEFYATLKDVATNPEREHLLPLVLTLFKKLYVDDMFIDQGLSGWKIDLNKNEMTYSRNQEVNLQQPQVLVQTFVRQKDKVNETQFVFI